MKTPPDIHLAFDVGHSSIGWAAFEKQADNDATLLGCGAVIFPADDCLASTRRGFRRQRRHTRATRLRIARLARFLEFVTGDSEPELTSALALYRDGSSTSKEPGCAWPWLLTGRVLRGGKRTDMDRAVGRAALVRA